MDYGAPYKPSSEIPRTKITGHLLVISKQRKSQCHLRAPLCLPELVVPVVHVPFRCGIQVGFWRTGLPGAIQQPAALRPGADESGLQVII